MINAVLDAKFLASGSLSAGAAPGQLLLQWQAGAFVLITSEELLNEVRRTLRKPYFVSRASGQRSSRLLALLRYRSIMTPITVSVAGVATHPEDDLVLAAALSAKADYLVTGDMKLQDLRSYLGVGIVSPTRTRLTIDTVNWRVISSLVTVPCSAP